MRVQSSSRPSWNSLGLALALLCVPACGGGGGGGGGSGAGSSGSSFKIVEASNGFGKLLPHQIAVRDSQGLPTDQVIELTRFDQLIANATLTNPIRPPTEWPPEAALPNGMGGNHFLFVRFGQPIDPTSVLSRDPSDPPGTIGTGIQVQTVDSLTRVITPLRGRAFVGGKTFGPSFQGGQYLLEEWVHLGDDDVQDQDSDPDLAPSVTSDGKTPGLGFPGSEPGTTFAGDLTLIDPAAFVFVLDEDGDLTTHETFPQGKSIQMRIGSSVRSVRGRFLDEVGLASSTVGPDTLAPEVEVDEDG